MIRNLLPAPSDRKWTAVLAALALIQIAVFIYYLCFLNTEGYLPPPFISNKFDTFMDFFNPMYWADHDARYTEWGSVYPPLNFIFLKLLRWALIGSYSFATPILLRQGAISVQLFLVVIYLCIPAFIVSRPYWGRFSIVDRFLIYTAAILSAPMLFALERGNLIFLSMGLMPLLFVRKPFVRLLAVALLVNLKPYFLLLYLVYVAKRSWNELAVALMVTGVIYLLTGVLLDSDPLAIPMNLLGFSEQKEIFSLREVISLPSSISAFSYVITSGKFLSLRPDFLAHPTRTAFFIETAKWTAQALALWALTSKARTMSIKPITALVLVMVSNIGVSVGGYTMVFYLALLPAFSRMRFRFIYMGVILMLALPLDLLIVEHHTDTPPLLSYLSGRVVVVPGTLSAGALIRPLLNWILLVAVAWEFMGKQAQHVQAVRSYGLKDSSPLSQTGR